MALSEDFWYRFDGFHAIASTLVKRGTSLCRLAHFGKKLDTIPSRFSQALIWCLCLQRECCPSKAQRACSRAPRYQLCHRTFGASVLEETGKEASQLSIPTISEYQIWQTAQNRRSWLRMATQLDRLFPETCASFLEVVYQTFGGWESAGAHWPVSCLCALFWEPAYLSYP